MHTHTRPTILSLHQQLSRSLLVHWHLSAPSFLILSLGSFQWQRKIQKSTFYCLYINLLKLLNPDSNKQSLCSGKQNVQGFTELFLSFVECAGSWPSGACFRAFDCFYNVAKWSLLKDSENNCGRPSPPPHTIYFPHRMLESSELNGTCGTQEKNKRAKYQPSGAGHTAFLPIPEPFSSQVLGLLCSFKIINFKQACSHCCFCYHNSPDIEKKREAKKLHAH